MGFEELAQRLPEYAPERVATITGHRRGSDPSARARVRDHAPRRDPPARGGWSITRTAASAFRAISCLPALVGAWRERGGGLLSHGVRARSRRHRLVVRHLRARGPIRPFGQHGAGRSRADRPVDRSADRRARRLQLEPGGDRARTRTRCCEGLRREDLFTVVLEHVLTDTARLCRHRPACDDAARAPRRALGRRATLRDAQRAGDRAARRSAAEHRDLPAAGRADGLRGCGVPRRPTKRWSRRPSTRRCGEDRATSSSCEQRLDAASSTDAGPPYADGGFLTPSGKCELYSERLASVGMDPLPGVHAAPESPAGDPSLAAPLSARAADGKGAHHFLNSTLRRMSIAR